MSMSRDAMAHCFLRAAALASNRRFDRRAVPENASASEASRSVKPRSTRRNLMARSISPISLLTNFRLYTYIGVMVFDALDAS
eukprot:6690063-Pyramimonas_sp.AAC.1